MILRYRFAREAAEAPGGCRRRYCVILLCCLAAVNVACSNEAAKRRYFESGARYLESGRPADAIVEFRNAVDRDERWGQARFALAEAYAANGDPENAYQNYTRAADLMPDNAAAQVKAATYLLLVGQYEDARTRVQRLLEKEPRNIQAHILLGNALAGLRDLEGAVTQINQAIQLEPTRSQTYTNLAIIKVAQGQRDEARAAFERAVQIDGQSVAARLALANFQWSVGDRPAAERSLQQAGQIDSTNVLTHRALAVFYLASRRPANAEQHLTFLAEVARTADAKLTLADYYTAMGRPDDARRVLEPLATDAAVAIAAEIRLAAIAYSTGQTVDAEARLNTVLKREPNNLSALLLNARWLLHAGKREQALERAKRAVSIDARMAEAHYVRGLAEAQTRRSNDAIKSFSEVMRLNPRAVAAQVQLSRLHLARNSVDSAVLLAEEALKNAPDSIDALLALSRAWGVRGDFKRATATLAELKKQAPATAQVYALDGTLHMLTRDTVTARKAFERALQIDLSSMEALAGLTTLDVLQNDVTVARARIEPRIAADPDNPELLLLAAKVFVADRQPARAEELLRRAIALDPLDTANFSLLGRIYANEHRLDAAKAEFDELARREHTNLAARIMGAMIVHAQGHLAEAQTRYARILQLEPRAALAANNLASIYADAGENLDYARQLAESASEEWPAHADIQDTLGWIYYKQHRYGLAIRRFQQSVATEPDNPLYHYRLGLAYTKNGERDLARRALQQALRLNAGFVEARQALASLGN